MYRRSGTNGARLRCLSDIHVRRNRESSAYTTSFGSCFRNILIATCCCPFTNYHITVEIWMTITGNRGNKKMCTRHKRWWCTCAHEIVLSDWGQSDAYKMYVKTDGRTDHPVTWILRILRCVVRLVFDTYTLRRPMRVFWVIYYNVRIVAVRALMRLRPANKIMNAVTTLSIYHVRGIETVRN